MSHLSVRPDGFLGIRGKAFEDAKKMQAVVEEECRKSGKPVPGYDLTELIGKGSFGRVYKAIDHKSSKVVAVKTIDVDESDSSNPHAADTYSEFLKEIKALQVLNEAGAQNINHVIEALPVGKAMWMVTEYCAGGSVATLMKPTAPGGLQEKWIIPILREVATAVFWVHKHGIIHRDIKCANVLVTEVGAVQLCDFGVAGMMETKVDKRSTFIGTPHWMAPELFDQNTQYGTEVDIWAFGSMVFEIASGLPPNATNRTVGFTELGDYIRDHLPRLEGTRYSNELKSLVAYCLVEDPAQRPSIEEVQKHPYISNTASRYPTSSLSALVKAFKLWEEGGGTRKSLFAMGGAQGPLDLDSTSLAADEWNFSTTLAFDEQLHDDMDMSVPEAVRDVYGTAVEFEFPGVGHVNSGFEEETARAKMKGRRRPPQQVLNAFKAPLEKLFDPNTISSYHDNSRMYYGRPQEFAPPDAPEPPQARTSDLPLRNDSSHQDVRESLIDLDASLGGGSMSDFMDMGTIKAPAPRAAGPRASLDNGWSFGSSMASSDTQEYRVPDYSVPDYSVPDYSGPLTDPADFEEERGTGGPAWQWPTTIPPASSDSDMGQFSMNDDYVPASARPRLIHQSTEPAGLPSQNYDLQVPKPSAADRMSTSSLIDLDMSMPEPNMPDFSRLPDLTRPSTANSDVASMTGSELGGGGPFELERHASVYASLPVTNREPSIYVSDDSEFASAIRQMPTDTPVDLTAMTSKPSHDGSNQARPQQYQDEPLYSGSSHTYIDNFSTRGSTMLPAVAPPSASVLEARATQGDVANEMRRLIGSLKEHLSLVGEQVAAMEPRRYRDSINYE
ncbi:kinase-like domain-containing protein [Microdochium trichocladiopsis]|uniref:non-specific serine/threonine protein kinase n=1 Tax=Microdochium trichocladiopsis TaxID=1682393 RepID=A0A9P9BW76_9PEZI|nr:kinase-like domain-containing protein [Microdochium trichocladiopsis]KAH7034801.1 kinase-like domain-containing protein [Microdochium trichocladiopsis]